MQNEHEKVVETAPVAQALPGAAQEAPAGGLGGEQLEALENVDFLLEEIENKIAPLALA
jgi:hypothetical protein